MAGLEGRGESTGWGGRSPGFAIPKGSPLGVLIPGFPRGPQVPFSPEQWRVLSSWQPSFPWDGDLAGRGSLSPQKGCGGSQGGPCLPLLLGKESESLLK